MPEDPIPMSRSSVGKRLRAPGDFGKSPSAMVKLIEVDKCVLLRVSHHINVRWKTHLR